MSGNAGGQPTGGLLDKINASFAGFDGFKEKFSQAAITRFGSGWAWLSVDSAGGLMVNSTPNQHSPLMEGLTPIYVTYPRSHISHHSIFFQFLVQGAPCNSKSSRGFALVATR